MKNKIRYFLKLRKQNDVVKWICIFVLSGAAFLISAACHIRAIYRYVNTPAEYVLAGESVISQRRVDELWKSKDVAMVSRQTEVPVSISCQGAVAEITATVLSEEYIEGMCGAEALAGTKKIYMNETAFREFQFALSEDHVDIQSVGQTDDAPEYDIRYFMAEATEDPEGEAVTRPDYKTAKLIVQKAGQQEECAVFMAGTDSQLLKEACSLRVQFAKHDLDGLHVDWLKKLGYVIENEEMVVAEEYEIKQELLHVQYGLLCFAICLAAVFVLARKSIWDGHNL